MRPLLNYYGGKWNAAEWIISHFPKHKIYVEVFGGGASVLLQKERSPREVLNDLDDEIVNLYQVVRDQGEELKRVCELTPHARVEYKLAREKSDNPIEQARRTIIKSYFGIGDSIQNKTGFRFSRESNICVASSWNTWSEQLDWILARFKGVTVENLDYKDLLKKYDSPDTLFYLDPPYVKSTRNKKHSYRHDFHDLDHFAMIDAVKEISGFSVISGYKHPIYDRLGWKEISKEFKTQKHSFGVETLWLCPKTINAQSQLNFELGRF